MKGTVDTNPGGPPKDGGIHKMERFHQNPPERGWAGRIKEWKRLNLSKYLNPHFSLIKLRSIASPVCGDGPLKFFHYSGEVVLQGTGPSVWKKKSGVIGSRQTCSSQSRARQGAFFQRYPTDRHLPDGLITNYPVSGSAALWQCTM